MANDDPHAGDEQPVSLLERLSSPNVYDALEVEPDAREGTLRSALETLRAQLSVLSESEPDHEALHRRLDQLAGLVGQPMERAIHARAATLRQDVEDPDVRAHLAAEWLEREVWRLLNDGQIREATPLAEHFYKLAPNDVLAKSAVAWVRGVAGPVSGREAAATLAASAAQESPKSVEARLALASVNLAAGRKDRALAALRGALEIAPTDRRVARLGQSIHAEATPARRAFLSFDLAAMPKATRTALIVTACLVVARLLLLAFGV